MGRDKDLKLLSMLFLRAQQTEKICRVRIVAAVIHNGDLVSACTPRIKTDPFQARFAASHHNIHLHAEIAALAAVKGSCEGLTMYVARVGAHGEPRLAKPCWACQKAIMSFGLKAVYWSETHENSKTTLGSKT